MSFKYSFTFPISGPNKLPRFKNWAMAAVPEIALSLPVQVPVKADAMTVRLRCPVQRDTLASRLEGAKI